MHVIALAILHGFPRCQAYLLVSMGQITKDSGEAGGFSAKARAAAALRIPLLVIRRPQVQYPRVANSLGAVLEALG